MDVPVVGPPLSGGAPTAELAAAVSEAGGFGFLAAGYKTAPAATLVARRGAQAHAALRR